MNNKFLKFFVSLIVIIAIGCVSIGANRVKRDVDVSGATLLSTGVSGAGRNSGEESREMELILKQNEDYVFRATANAAGYVNFRLNWYEHTDKAE